MKKRIKAVLAIFAMLCSMLVAIPANAEELQPVESEKTVSDVGIVPLSGHDVLNPGYQSIGGFTFTNTNLTPYKTVGQGAQTLKFKIYFRIAPTDRGIGKVKVSMQIRDTSGHALSGVTSAIDRYNPDPNNFVRGTYLETEKIHVNPGQKVQVWFDVSSVNPAESNGNYRSAWVVTFTSIVNE